MLSAHGGPTSSDSTDTFSSTFVEQIRKAFVDLGCKAEAADISETDADSQAQSGPGVSGTTKNRLPRLLRILKVVEVVARNGYIGL